MTIKCLVATLLNPDGVQLAVKSQPMFPSMTPSKVANALIDLARAMDKFSTQFPEAELQRIAIESDNG